LQAARKCFGQALALEMLKVFQRFLKGDLFWRFVLPKKIARTHEKIFAFLFLRLRAVGINSGATQ
jgi:hypothetical protein